MTTEDTIAEESQLDKKENKSSWGGARPGSGRPKGKQNAATLERNRIEQAVKQRILAEAEDLANQMLILARGCSFVYKEIPVGIDGKKTKHVLVTDPEEIEDFLNGTNHDDIYRYITTEKPDFRALEALLDRVFGKSTQNTNMNLEVAQKLNKEDLEQSNQLLDKFLEK